MSETGGSHDKRSLREAQHGKLMSALLQPAAVARPRSRTGNVLDGGERLRIIDTLLVVLRGAYCHLHQKRAAYAADPVQALELLRVRASELSEAQFHLALTAIVTGLRDAHTRYSGPSSMQGAVAVLPFLVEQYGPLERPQFVVSKVAQEGLVDDPEFQPGVTLELWNGIPFARAVELHAARETGGRPDSRMARALESLTFRALEYGPPPDEEWVIIGFRAGRAAMREVRIPWRIVKPRSSPSGHRAGSRASRFIAADPTGEARRRARKLMFSGALWVDELVRAPQARGAGWLQTQLPDNFAARSVQPAASAPVGYLRIWSFDAEDDDAFVDEVVRLLELLPQDGLIIDLRGNPGGLIWAAERMLQLFTPQAITPVRFSLLATPLTRAMARSPFNRLELQAWEESLESALWTGESYSQPLPITDPAWCNDIGQRYGGPVVCVVDANTYSSGDIFAAGFVDNGIGPLVCVGEASGGGGANVWTSTDMKDVLADTPFALESLPDGVQYSLAIRRITRTGPAEGLPVEDVGVRGIPYAMTRDDLLHDNADLLAFCARQLDRSKASRLSVSVAEGRLVVETKGLDRLEIFADGCAGAAAVPIEDGAHDLALPLCASLELIGRHNGEICQRRRLAIGPA